MRLSLRLIATVAVAVLLMPTSLLRADDVVKPSTGANDATAVDSNALPAAPMPAAAQSTATTYTTGTNRDTPKVELFMGYSYLRAVPTRDAENRFVYLNGGSTSLALNFNRYLGIVGDFGGYNDTRLLLTGAGLNPSINAEVVSGSAFSYLLGPRLSFRDHGRFTPFVQALFGGIHASEITLSGCTGSCTLLPEENVFAMTAGGGLDIRLHRHFALRLIQAEYLMTAFENHSSGANGLQNDMRLSSGIVFGFGGRTPPPVLLACSAIPTDVFSGQEVTINCIATNLNPKRAAVYTWTGVDAKGTGPTAKVDTTNLAPGSYTVQGTVTQGKKMGQFASSSASFRVKAYELPTISCSANPATIRPGETSTISATGVSPQGRPLTYSYSAPAGSVSGTSSTATFTATPGTPIDTVQIQCNVADDKGHLVSATTPVTITAPYVPPAPKVSELCSITFEKDKQRPTRVDNEAKACLDDVALSLQKQSDAKVVLVGQEDSKEKALAVKQAKRKSKQAPSMNEPSVQRAVNTKEYLVKDKGVDASRITVLSGSTDSQKVQTYLVPSGATFDTTGTAPVDESSVKAQARKPLPTQKHKRTAK